MTTKNITNEPCRSNQKSGRGSRAASKRSASNPAFPKAKRPLLGESASGPCKGGSKGNTLGGFTCKRSSASLKKRIGGGNSGPTAADPLADVFDLAELVDRVRGAEAVKRWCAEYPKGGTVNGKAGEIVKIEPEQSRRMLCEAEEILSIHAPRRSQFLHALSEYDRQAREVYPAMFKAGSAEAERFQSLLEALPEVMRFPDYALILGDCLTGFNVRYCTIKSQNPSRK